MERDGGWSWLVIALLVLLGIGLAWMGVRAYEAARMNAAQAQHMQAVQMEAQTRLRAQQAEIERLQRELERLRRSQEVRAGEFSQS